MMGNLNGDTGGVETMAHMTVWDSKVRIRQIWGFRAGFRVTAGAPGAGAQRRTATTPET